MKTIAIAKILIAIGAISFLSTTVTLAENKGAHLDATRKNSDISATNSTGETPCVQAANKLREVIGHSADSAPLNEQIASYQSAITLCPSMAEAYYNLGILYVREKNLKAGLENLKIAHEKKPENLQFTSAYATAAFEAGDQLLAETLYLSVLKQDAHSIKALQGLSVIADRAGNLSQAAEYLARAETEAPHDLVTLFNSGLIKEKQGQLKESSEVYERLLKIDPLHEPAGMRLVGLLIEQARFVEAQQILTRIIEKNPRNVEAYKLSATLQSRADDTGKAILSLKRALEIEPDNLGIVTLLADMLLRQGAADEARVLLERGRIKFPSDTHLLDLLGQVAMELGDFSLAEESFRKALAINALDAQIHYNFSILLRRIGRTKESQQQREASLKLDPRLADMESTQQKALP